MKDLEPVAQGVARLDETSSHPPNESLGVEPAMRSAR